MNDTTPTLDPKVVEQVLLGGDLSKLTPAQRTSFYNRVCETLGLNPLTRPFDYLTLNGKSVLYAKKDATEQLRKIHGVSITSVTSQQVGDVFVVTANAQSRDGRTDASTGAVATGTLKGEALANALMKAETKAKRRVTLSICGLGLLDETEVETVPGTPLLEASPPEPPPFEGGVYIERLDYKQTKGGKPYCDVITSTGESHFCYEPSLMQTLEQMKKDRIGVRLVTEKTSKGFTKVIEILPRVIAEDPPFK